MKVKSDDKEEIVVDNKLRYDFFIDFLKEYFDVKEDVKNIKIYSGSIEIFDSEKYINKNDTTVDSESNKIKD